MTKNLCKLVLVGSFISSSLLAISISNAQDNLTIGVITPLTGPFARYGEKIQQSILKYSDPTVKFIFEDEGCDPKKAITAYKKLSERAGVKLFIGPFCGSPQSAVAPLLIQDQQLAIVGNSAPESVFRASNGRMFSTQYSIEVESDFLARKITEHQVKSVVVIFRDNAFSRAHEATFRSSFKGETMATLTYTSDDPSELKAIALKVKQLNPEALFVPDAFPLMAGLTKELRNLGIKKRIYCPYSAQSDDVLKALGADGDDMIYSYPDIGENEALSFFSTMAAKILVNAAKDCKNQIQCIITSITNNSSFNKQGILSGKLRLKTIRSGAFVPFRED